MEFCRFCRQDFLIPDATIDAETIALVANMQE